MSTGGDLRRFAADLRGSWRRRAVDTAVEEVKRAVDTAARRAVGGDLAMTGQRSRLGVRVTRSERGAVVSAAGPWTLVERPRRGGYVIRPKRKGGALQVGRGVWRASAKGGPISAPLRPFAKGAEAAVAPAWAAVARELDRAVTGA